MKRRNAVVIFLISFVSLVGRTTQGEIYKYVDPETGLVQYSNQPKKTSVRMSSGDTLSEIPRAAVSNIIYKCTDPATGAEEYTPSVKDAANCVDATATVVADPKFVCDQRCQKIRATRANSARALNKQFPGACSQHEAGGWWCRPRVGMRVDRDQASLDLHKIGYVEDEKGKLDRWRSNGCIAMSRGNLFVSVSC